MLAALLLLQHIEPSEKPQSERSWLVNLYCCTVREWAAIIGKVEVVEVQIVQIERRTGTSLDRCSLYLAIAQAP